jgi:hypothetical protein
MLRRVKRILSDEYASWKRDDLRGCLWWLDRNNKTRMNIHWIQLLKRKDMYETNCVATVSYYRNGTKYVFICIHWSNRNLVEGITGQSGLPFFFGRWGWNERELTVVSNFVGVDRVVAGYFASLKSTYQDGATQIKILEKLNSCDFFSGFALVLCHVLCFGRMPPPLYMVTNITHRPRLMHLTNDSTAHIWTRLPLASLECFISKLEPLRIT